MAQRNRFDLRTYFDRVVLINLKRRPDRLQQVRRALRQCQWPFQHPEIIEAVDGNQSPPPEDWKFGLGAWGCLKSHQFVARQAIKDGVKSLLVLEDDVCFTDNFRLKVEKFLRRVPTDWDQIMLGGQHINKNGEPGKVKSGVYRCTDCERTHCYAIRGQFMAALAERWERGGMFNGRAHCDWIMARDPDMQFAHKVYVPSLFLVGQERGESDIYGEIVPRKFWNPPRADLSVINLRAPLSVALSLRPHGFYTGLSIRRNTNRNRSYHKIFSDANSDDANRVKALREWIKGVQWDLADDPAYVCTICHPLASSELVRAASPWRVHEITADTAADALAQLPPKLNSQLARHQPARSLVRDRVDRHHRR